MTETSNSIDLFFTVFYSIVLYLQYINTTSFLCGGRSFEINVWLNSKLWCAFKVLHFKPVDMHITIFYEDDAELLPAV